MPYQSNAAAYRRRFTAEMGRRVKAASIYLSTQVRADVGQAGTLRLGGHRDERGRSPKGTGRSVTVYNFTHSAPGNPPYKQRGRLRASIAYEVAGGGLVGRVGSNLKNPRYPYWLETGTRRMRARPYLRRALVLYRGHLAAVLTRTTPAGGLPPAAANPSRPGMPGRGARAAGYG